MVSRIIQDRKDLLLEKYLDYKHKSEMAKQNKNIPMYEMYNSKLNAIRMTLSLLEIHVEGINQKFYM